MEFGTVEGPHARTHTAGKAEMEQMYIQKGSLKPTLILTTLLFLLIAPAPDSRDIAEMSGNFLVADSQSGLMASPEPVPTTAKKL